MSWQPIETAEKTGHRYILVWGPSYGSSRASYWDDGWRDALEPQFKPALLDSVTHWMPFPEPPEAQK